MDNNNKIPKMIHYCWFGRAEKPNEVIEYIDNWKKKLPDYTIVEWNEDNYDVFNSCAYVEEAYKAKKWAFVSDYIRLDVLYKYGGIYLDTDIEILKDFNNLLKFKSFISSESKFSICTAVIGVEAGASWVKEILDRYLSRKFLLNDGKHDVKPNSQYLYDFFSEKYGFQQSYKEPRLFDEIVVFPPDYFSPINYNTRKSNITENTYTIHHYSGGWKTPKEKLKDNLLAFLTRIVGEKNREKIKNIYK